MQQYLLGPRGLKQNPRKKSRGYERNCTAKACTPATKVDVFSKELKDFDPKTAVYNFAYNASTPELEEWLADQVRAFRTGGGAINPLPHEGQVKLTCTSFGPGNCEAAIDREIEKLLRQDSGWLIFNTHGLDDEGWGPIRATYLDRLLDKLLGIEPVGVLPAGRALRDYVDD